MPDISVVIPTYNRLDTLQHVFPTLLAQDLPRDRFELLVCDSNSTDGTAEYHARGGGRSIPTSAIFPARTRGRAMARNAGHRRGARPQVVLFNDSDILASPDLLSHAPAPSRRARAIWRSSAGKCRSRTSTTTRTSATIPPSAGICTARRASSLPWLYFLTGNASVRARRPAARRPFDESFTGYGHEDLELGYRLQKAGVTIVYEPRAVNYHCQDVRDTRIKKRR